MLKSIISSPSLPRSPKKVSEVVIGEPVALVNMSRKRYVFEAVSASTLRVKESALPGAPGSCQRPLHRERVFSVFAEEAASDSRMFLGRDGEP